ncbi:MAG: MFS transporter, partial [Planctomycetes bacterium]|nr:MFS transporter [Planctomycetota bacterium]
DLYPLEERGKMQGLVAAVWGFSSIVGPLVGGVLTDHLSWRWVFFVNVPIGVLAASIVQIAWKEPARRNTGRRVDVAGAVFTLSAAGLFMAACAMLNRGGLSPVTIACFAASVAAAAGLVLAERRASDPFIAYELFRIKLFSTGVACGAFASIALFCATTYITLYMQAVLGSSAQASGFVLVPMTMGWVLMSGVASPLSLHIGYRPLALVGMALATAAYALLAPLGAHATWLQVAVPLGLLGMGLGSVLTPLLIAAQNAVPKEKLGSATSLTQFCRTMVAAVGVAVMGVILTVTMAPRMPAGLHPDDVLNAIKRSSLAPQTLASIRDAIAAGLHGVFLVGLFAGVAGFLSALLLPRGSGRALAHRS